jgi:hypothetical protein
MNDDDRRTGPGQARQLLDELEVAIVTGPAELHGLYGSAPAATTARHRADASGLHDDWVPAIPGAGEPPD